MNRYITVQNIITQLTDDLTFRTFFTLYLMAETDAERMALDARFWQDASELDDGKQQLLRAELRRTFLRLPALINLLHEKVAMASA